MEISSLLQNSPQMPRQSFFRLLGAACTAMLFSGNTSGCSSTEATPDPQPSGAITLDLTDPVNKNLTVKGGYVISQNMLVAQTMTAQFVAVESRCTFDQTLLVFKPADNHFYCPKDLSRFDLKGKVVNGPATVPLKVYTVGTPVAGKLQIQG
ncbi:hypothetical protein GCM10027578_39780 [Spirosoma luteolum]